MNFNRFIYRSFYNVLAFIPRSSPAPFNSSIFLPPSLNPHCTCLTFNSDTPALLYTSSISFFHFLPSHFIPSLSLFVIGHSTVFSLSSKFRCAPLIIHHTRLSYCCIFFLPLGVHSSPYPWFIHSLQSHFTPEDCFVMSPWKNSSLYHSSVL